MLAGRKAGVMPCSYCETAVLLGGMAPLKGRAANILVAFNQAIQKPAVAGFLVSCIVSRESFDNQNVINTL